VHLIIDSYNKMVRMQVIGVISFVFTLLVICCSTPRANKEAITEQRLPVKCMENSPERRGEEGCTILANREFVGSTDNVYWHIDRFDSVEAAKKAAGPNGVAVEAHGFIWLMTVEARIEEQHTGHHLAWIGPLTLPAAERYLMRVQSSLLMPGSETPVHTHSGPEAFYIVDGEQCIEMQQGGEHLIAGQSYVVPASNVHRGRVVGTAPRRAMALILYDALQPASHDLVNPPTIVACK
jgi:quercetin dioxygenase-like cupin family protein